MSVQVSQYKLAAPAFVSSADLLLCLQAGRGSTAWQPAWSFCRRLSGDWVAM